MKKEEPKKIDGKISKAFGHVGDAIDWTIDCLKPLNNIEGKGAIKIIKSESNIIFSLLSDPYALASASIHPFKLFVTSQSVSVWPGDVNNYIPKINGDFINATPNPTLSISSTGSVYVECTMDSSGSFTDVEIKKANTLPTDTSTLRYRQIGTVGKISGSYFISAQTVMASLSHKLCGGQSTWGTT